LLSNLNTENVNGMQTMLNIFSEYCNTWKLQVNIAKTNVVIFSKSNVTQNTRCMSDNKELDIGLMDFFYFLSCSKQSIKPFVLALQVFSLHLGNCY
jgi:hypothetical protein